jgi:hypothetical protein
MPLLPRSVAELKWFPEHARRLFAGPGGFYLLPGAALAAFVVGAAASLRDRKGVLWALLLPILFTLLASGLHRYPFTGRLLLFIVPALMLLIARAVCWLWTRRQGRLPAFALCLLLIAAPAAYTARDTVTPPHKEALRPVLRQVAQRLQPEDTIYVYHEARHAFRYYAPRYLSGDEAVIVGSSHRRDPDGYRGELDELDGKGRVWILISHVYIGEREVFLDQLDSLGTQLDGVAAEGAWAYLYDL